MQDLCVCVHARARACVGVWGFTWLRSEDLGPAIYLSFRSATICTYHWADGRYPGMND
jgi:hypothetical protein